MNQQKSGYFINLGAFAAVAIRYVWPAN